MNRIAIYGSGGFGRELILANSCRTSQGVIFISDNPAEIGTEVEGVRVYSLEDVARIDEESRATFKASEWGPADYRPIKVVIAVSGHETRRALDLRVRSAGLEFGAIRAPTHVRGPGVEIGEGAILCDFTMITASAKIGRHFHANIYSYVAHDCVIGDFVTLAPRVCINGNTVVEDDVYIGTGAVLKQGMPDKPLRIGKGAVIGMGAVVTKDVEPGAVVVGNPARPRG